MVTTEQELEKMQCRPKQNHLMILMRYGTRAFSVAGPSVWNSLQISDLVTFKFPFKNGYLKVTCFALFLLSNFLVLM